MKAGMRRLWLNIPCTASKKTVFSLQTKHVNLPVLESNIFFSSQHPAVMQPLWDIAHIHFSLQVTHFPGNTLKKTKTIVRNVSETAAMKFH